MDRNDKDVDQYNVRPHPETEPGKTYELAQNEQLIGFYAYTKGHPR